MSQIKMDSEDIATIKNALQVIQLNAELITPRALHASELSARLSNNKEIVKQVKRIDKLLPDVKFEGGKQCQQ